MPDAPASRRCLFIDRDGTMIQEFPPTYQIDSFSKLSFYPHVFHYLGRIARELDFELVLVSNQDGLGTAKFPEEDFWPVHNLVMGSFANEGVLFREELIDRSMPDDKLPTRKPGTGMFGHYLNNPAYDLAGSYVIGDRITDVQLAKNLGCGAIWLKNNPALGGAEVTDGADALGKAIVLETQHWKDIYEFLRKRERSATHHRSTSETQVDISVNLEGTGQSTIRTGLGFFDHMLDQVARHGSMDLRIEVRGDLHIDEHHTVEDTAIALGEAFAKALGNKRGIERYGFALPMDETEAKVLLDFGGRNWIVWNVVFRRERVGDLPTEMFYHFFKSFSDAAKCNLHIECRGDNEHHKIEAIFKAFAKALKMAVKKDPLSNQLPSTKGAL
ncbi:bifunctional histidinol-phosphatase/imidazoleglycerol-phosphate dehydratase HisB [Flaviaesturariibacter aridisoli]|uniref:Histidine biosynthesis bifunctional protein HisB n=1 Tax=Flaviaesturariibacter aridisoli TaxID=2545761 RepID=A0A4R4DWY2_9BACT|nr:bifunctional histidinol-phosphatase/imidazoleglycerol-phosphate dehydratase HisB [Flaviaesturariibacter aridisoli]TCZ69073.1 bifunctional histidinol-phosphatase/imidazoleglycerol-phosphate dehydratase HisB [Flaviaesturariibacter aridisoli]